MHDKTPTSGSAATGSGATAHLSRLHDLHDYKVAHGEPHVRGWHVKTADGQKVGKVDDLIVDTDAMQVRYLDVELDKKAFNLDEDRHVLLPIRDARLDEHEDEVLLDAMTATQLAALSPYRSGDAIAPGHMPTRAEDTQQFYGKRGGTGGIQRVEVDRGQSNDRTRS